MQRFIHFVLGVTSTAGILLFSIGAAHAYQPGEEMCTARAQGTPAGVIAHCKDGPNGLIAAISVVNNDDGTSDISFGVWNRLSDKQEKCNGVAVCWANAGSYPIEQWELPRYETVVTTVDIGGAISWVDNFTCMCVERRP